MKQAQKSYPKLYVKLCTLMGVGISIYMSSISLVLQGSVGCLSNKTKVDKFDHKTTHYVACNCDCQEMVASRRNLCLRCNHEHDAHPLIISNQDAHNYANPLTNQTGNTQSQSNTQTDQKLMDRFITNPITPSQALQKLIDCRYKLSMHKSV